MADSAQLKDIHQAWLSFVHEFSSIPGEPGLGLDDRGLSTTANMYSAMIAQDYFNPDILISTFERNPLVTEDRDYDFSAYDPSNDVHWDPTFVADLETGSNVSYAHMPLLGERMERQWRDIGAASLAVFGNRWPSDGVASAHSYSFRKNGSWLGSLVFNDNPLETLSATAGLKIGGGPDNLFNFDTGLNGLDQVLAFTKEVKDNQAVLQHD